MNSNPWVHHPKLMLQSIRRPSSVFVLSILTVFFFLCTVYFYTHGHRFDGGEYPINFNHTHSYITSAYYYGRSKSLGKNAVAIVAVMSQRTFEDLEKYQMTVVGTNNTHSLKSTATIKVETTDEDMFCEYVMVFIQCETLPNPRKLEIESSGSRVEIPFRHPQKTARSQVIICIAPQFVAEKWQVFLTHIHVARRYGGHMHVYVTSMLEELFNTLKVYERMGSLTLDYWVRMKFAETLSPYTDPMKSVEWRNQAGAQTDCLLQYKEVADYIAFFDIDDILIPRLSNNYHHEFASHFDAYPTYHSIFYNKRDVNVQRVTNVTDLSFRKMFSTMEILDNLAYGKSIVNPLKYNSTWIHHSHNLPRKRMLKVYNTEIIHVKHILDQELDQTAPFRLPKMFGTESDPMIREIDLKTLDMDFQNVYEDELYQETAVKMIDHDFYGPVVFKCYNESFYHPFFVEKKRFNVLCPNADDCVLPQREDIKCIHSDADYVSGPEMNPITFHYAIRPFWSRDIGCFQ